MIIVEIKDKMAGYLVSIFKPDAVTFDIVILSDRTGWKMSNKLITMLIA